MGDNIDEFMDRVDNMGPFDRVVMIFRHEEGLKAGQEWNGGLVIEVSDGKMHVSWPRDVLQITVNHNG